MTCGVLRVFICRDVIHAREAAQVFPLTGPGPGPCAVAYYYFYCYVGGVHPVYEAVLRLYEQRHGQARVLLTLTRAKHQFTVALKYLF